METVGVEQAERRFFLVDNGSKRAAATLSLRQVAARLGERCGETVEPVSLLHSNKVPAAELEREPARTFGPAATRAARGGAREIVVIPFFFGPTLALTDYLPRRVAQLQESHPEVTVRVARTLADLAGPLDLRLASALADGVQETAAAGERPAVILVDHGSPVPEVTAVRNVLAGQLSVLLEGYASRVAAASMERREGDEYRFNEPLLERLLDAPGFNEGLVVIAMQFLSPGRHAGAGGDVATICAEAEARHPALATRRTPLLGDHPGVLEILAERLEEARDGRNLLVEASGRCIGAGAR